MRFSSSRARAKRRVHKYSCSDTNTLRLLASAFGRADTSWQHAASSNAASQADAHSRKQHAVLVARRPILPRRQQRRVLGVHAVSGHPQVAARAASTPRARRGASNSHRLGCTARGTQTRVQTALSNAVTILRRWAFCHLLTRLKLSAHLGERWLLRCPTPTAILRRAHSSLRENRSFLDPSATHRRVSFQLKQSYFVTPWDRTTLPRVPSAISHCIKDC